MKKYSVVEVPLVGYALTEDPWIFGYKELFLDDFKLDLYLSDKTKVSELKSIFKREGDRNILKTMFSGYGKASDLALATTGGLSTFLMFACAGGACPLWLSSVYSLLPILGVLTTASATVYGYTIEPFLASPPLVLLSALITKRLGQRKLVKYLEKKTEEENLSLFDYSIILGKIESLGMADKITSLMTEKYRPETRWRKFKRLFREDQKLKDLQQELYEDFRSLSDLTEKLAENSEEKEKAVYRTLCETYENVSNAYKPKPFKRKGTVIF